MLAMTLYGGIERESGPKLLRKAVIQTGVIAIVRLLTDC